MYPGFRRLSSPGPDNQSRCQLDGRCGKSDSIDTHLPACNTLLHNGHTRSSRLWIRDQPKDRPRMTRQRRKRNACPCAPRRTQDNKQDRVRDRNQRHKPDRGWIREHCMLAIRLRGQKECRFYMIQASVNATIRASCGRCQCPTSWTAQQTPSSLAVGG